MSTYVILLPGDEATWESATPEQRRAGYDVHTAFAAELEKRGHRVVGGAELTHSRDARSIRSGSDGPVVSEGPYAELAEQMTGFYIVESEDPDDLAQVSGMLVGLGAGGVEIRGTVDHEGQG
jgi:hypothetical protein